VRHHIEKKAGFVLSAAFWIVALLHGYWALGGMWGLQESVGKGNPIPPAWSIWLVSAIAVGIALGVLGQIGVWGRSIPEIVFRIGAWLVFICLVAVTILNASAGRYWEVYLIAPICGVLSILAFVVARARRTI
jgi:hypothetical protein